jgi:aryl-alcohol dehydrogenase-like predicted oxidoreductase
MLVLGTANWGQFYGIGGTNVSQKDAHEILDCLLEKGFYKVDTAIVYGFAHDYLSKYERKDELEISTKIPGDLSPNQVTKLVQSKISFNKVLLHGIPEENEGLQLLKYKFFGRLGISLNSLEDLSWVRNNISWISRVQIPFNLLDKRWANYFEFFKENGVEIESRSAFLQGVLLSEDRLSMAPFQEYLSRSISEWQGQTTLNQRISTCMRFVKSFEGILGHVFGCDTVEQLKELTELYELERKEVFPQFNCNDESVLLPMNWKS